jgi:hypothetical protein
MMTIVRAQERAQGSEPEVATALDELAREGARRIILAALEVKVEEYTGGSTVTHVTAAAMRWWFATGRPGRVA